MPMRVRKLIGLFVLLGWIAVYALFVMGLAVRILPHAHWAMELAFYAVAGVAWIVPMMPLIAWMSRPDRGA